MDTATIIELIKLIALLALIAYLTVYLLRGAIYLPSRPAAVKQMVDALRIRPGERVVDLGSGDGRIVIAMAKAGAVATGYEVNPFLVWWSRANARRAGVADLTTFIRKSFWRASLADVHCITVFGMTHIMKELAQKLRNELPTGARIVSNGFEMPGWKGEQIARGIYRYQKTESSSVLDK